MGTKVNEECKITISNFTEYFFFKKLRIRTSGSVFNMQLVIRYADSIHWNTKIIQYFVGMGQQPAAVYS
jgi:hypothetical protein